jgi:hypothetical protein
LQLFAQFLGCCFQRQVFLINLCNIEQGKEERGKEKIPVGIGFWLLNNPSPASLFLFH